MNRHIGVLLEMLYRARFGALVGCLFGLSASPIVIMQVWYGCVYDDQAQLLYINQWLKFCLFIEKFTFYEATIVTDYGYHDRIIAIAHHSIAGCSFVGWLCGLVVEVIRFFITRDISKSDNGQLRKHISYTAMKGLSVLLGLPILITAITLALFSICRVSFIIAIPFAILMLLLKRAPQFMTQCLPHQERCAAVERPAHHTAQSAQPAGRAAGSDDAL